MLLQQLVNGVTLGSIYALIALGYTMVYGVLLMINFAHSEIFMAGAYAGLFTLLYLSKASFFGDNVIFLFFLVFLFSMSFTGMLGILVERIAYRPLRTAPRLAPLISAIGVSIFLQNLFMLYSRQSIPFPEAFPVREYTFFGTIFNSLQLFILFTSLALMTVLHVFITYSKLGKGIRATSQDRDTAALLGIPVDRMIATTFFIGASLGGAAGVLTGMYYHSIKYNMGFLPGIKAFTAAVLGGIGNIPGAMVGGFLLGILETMGAGFISSTYKDVFAFVILILVLIFRPTGILGERITEKA